MLRLMSCYQTSAPALLAAAGPAHGSGPAEWCPDSGLGSGSEWAFGPAGCLVRWTWVGFGFGPPACCLDPGLSSWVGLACSFGPEPGLSAHRAASGPDSVIARPASGPTRVGLGLAK